jgi:hypothetical protein
MKSFAIEILRCSLFAALVYAVHLPSTGIPGVGLALQPTISIQRALCNLLCKSDHYRRRGITVLRPRFRAPFSKLTTRQALLSYLLFIMSKDWEMAGACGSGERSRRADGSRLSSRDSKGGRILKFPIKYMKFTQAVFYFLYWAYLEVFNFLLLTEQVNLVILSSRSPFSDSSEFEDFLTESQRRDELRQLVSTTTKN